MMTIHPTRRAFALAALAPAARAAASRRLFNGKDLTGWQKAGNGIWAVESGEIIGRFDHAKPGPGYLLTEDEFADFDLKLEFRISKGGNSGVYVREPKRVWGARGDDRPGFGAAGGYEVQIDYNDQKNFTGALYNFSPAIKHAGAEEQWMPMRVASEGPRIRVWVAGELVNDFSPSRSAKGVIGLQIHGGNPHDHIVKFRAIEVTV
jgi:Domain of Unknown Function (DUF1080)